MTIKTTLNGGKACGCSTLDCSCGAVPQQQDPTVDVTGPGKVVPNWHRLAQGS